MRKFDIYKQINESTDIDFLKELLIYVDMDINNIGKNENDIIIKQKEEMYNLPIEKVYKKQLDGFTDLKNKIQKRINILTK